MLLFWMELLPVLKNFPRISSACVILLFSIQKINFAV